MPRTGIAHLPLHYGAAPPWLFQRMVELSRQLVLVIVEEYGPQEVLQRLSACCAWPFPGPRSASGTVGAQGLAPLLDALRRLAAF